MRRFPFPKLSPLIALGLWACRSAAPTPPPVAPPRPAPAAASATAPTPSVARSAAPAQPAQPAPPAIETLADLHECDTTRLLGLPREILTVYRELQPEGLVPLDDPRITSSDPLGVPLVKPSVRAAILATLNDPKLRRAGR